MTRIVVDASALAAVVFQESQAATVRDRLNGAALYAPWLLRYELANVAWTKARRDPRNIAGIGGALALALERDWGLVWCDVNAVDVLLIATATGITTYDASYLWLAGTLGADLVTLDERLANASARLM